MDKGLLVSLSVTAFKLYEFNAVKETSPFFRFFFVKNLKITVWQFLKIDCPAYSQSF